MRSPRCEHSSDMRACVVGMRQNGNTFKTIATELGMPLSTVKSIAKKYEKYGSVVNLPRCGRPRVTSPQTDRLITRTVLSDRRLSASSVRKELLLSSGVTVSDQTVRNRLKEQGLNGRVSQKRVFVSPENQKKRLAYALQHANMSPEAWEDILFTDESSFNVTYTKKRQMVWRRVGERDNLDCLRAAVKPVSGSVMVWGAISFNGTGPLYFFDGHVTKESYCDMLEIVIPQAKDMLQLQEDFAFLQDNAPPHASDFTMAYLHTKKIYLWNHPPASPDLNPIEHVWGHIKAKLADDPPTSLEDLKLKIQMYWNDVSLGYIRNLVHSMPRRLAEVIKNKGGPTGY